LPDSNACLKAITPQEKNMTEQKTDKPVTKLQPVPTKAPEVSDAVEIKKSKPKPERSNLTQREAVFQEIAHVLKEDKISFDGGTVKPHLNEERLKRVYDALVKGFMAKRISLKDNENNQKKLTEAALLRTYVIGLCNNWLRRDPRLNGKGTKKV
jgi:hypothetical protein